MRKEVREEDKTVEWIRIERPGFGRIAVVDQANVCFCGSSGS